ncbi:MAG: adenylate/guanylate cyclase domain-containing protein [Saprospiraceae bacterium]
MINTFEGFKLIATLYSEGPKIVCSAIRLEDNLPVILKIVSSEDSKLSDILRLRHEYELIKKLDFEGMVRALAIKESYQGVAIVMEFFEGIDLMDYLNTHVIDLPDFLQISIQLASILAELHQRRIIHKDIKPANILINKTTRQIRLIDFGIAVSLTQEHVANISHHDFEGSLHYISPEQTGRMNRSLDYRTDFYSSGVLFYEMLTGRKPFESGDVMELLHAHMAKKPDKLSNFVPGIPLIIEQIVFKLLEKSPENRYQNALGLKADLETCLLQYSQDKTIGLFPLSQRDLSDRFLISQKLYGRDKEISNLIEAFNHVSTGIPVLMLVSGVSGIGKSALIHEIYKPITERKGYFTNGKFEQFNRDIPYRAIIEAFSRIVQAILSENDKTIHFWKNRFLDAVGNNGQIIINVIPQIELIIGKQPAVVELPAAEAQNRFNYVFLSFAQIIASKEHPLVFVVDDLQWADLPSLKLIELLLTEKANNYLLILGSYRINEVGPTHPLLKTIATLQSNQCIIKKIELDALKLPEINQLLADTLHSHPESCNALSTLILSKTGGNPFFINEFLKALVADKLIFFNYTLNGWEWDIEKIKLRKITDNVVELMSGKIKLLNPQAQSLCRIASCIGNKFDLDSLAALYNNTPAQTAIDLWPAIQEGLILPVGNNYQLAESLHAEDVLADIEYKFLHDQVQNAAYSLISLKERQALHYKLGSLLLEKTTKDNKKDKIFEVANQLNMAIPLIVEDGSRIQLANLNLIAGKKAKDAAAYAPAFKYLKTGMEILPSSSWTNHYHLTLDLHNESAEAAYLNSDPDEMEHIISSILENTKQILDSVKAYIIQAQAYVSFTRNEDALNTCIKILNLFGVKFPANPNKLNILSSLLNTKFKLRGKSKTHLLALPKMHDANQSAIMEILSTAASPAYFAKPDLFPLIVFKQIQLSVKYGNHLHSGFAYSTYGLIMCGSTNEFDEGQKFGQLAVGLLNKFDANNLYAKIHFLNGFFIRLWKVHYLEVTEELFDAYQKGLETGDFLFASYAAFNIQAIGLYTGTPLSELKKNMDEYASALLRIKQHLGLGWLNIYRESVQNLMDTTSYNTILFGSELNELNVKEIHSSGKDYSGLCVFYLNKMMLAYWFEKPTEAMDHGVASMKFIDSVLGGGHVPMIHFYYALSLLSVAGSDPIRTDCIKKAKQQLNKMKMWAKTAPSNHLSKQYLIEAELQRVKGNTERAIPIYILAIEAAAANHYLIEEALANELLGKLYYNSKNETDSKKYLSQAKQLYIKWGAMAKVKQLNENFRLESRADLDEKSFKDFALSKTGTFSQPGRTVSDELDMASLNKASIAISGEIVLNKLLNKLMQILIENAGAQQGYLILDRDSGWFIEMQGESISPNIEPSASMPLEHNNVLPEAIVHYVIRTKEDLVIDNLNEDQRFSTDAMMHKPISVVCLPIVNQGRLLAILYADNHLHSGVFTQKRIQFLKLLSGQIAVSLQNALLFESLELKVLERTQQLTNEKKKSDDLLLNILPAEVADELKQKGTADARQYDDVTVLFTDFVDFTKISEKLSPKELVQELDTCFKAFDKIIERHGLEKIKTIGDSYMAVSGLPINDKNHAYKAVQAAMDIRDFIQASTSPFAGDAGHGIRIGLNSGTVVAGIVGNKKFAYDIWGDTVNVANRMESSSEPGKINISGKTYEQVKDRFKFIYRGKIVVKNKGEIDMYFVE